MLRRHARLVDRDTIAQLFRAGRVYGCGAFIIRTLPRAENETLFAIIAPKKIYRRAVDRVTVRRRVRALVAHIMPQCAQGWVCVIMPRSTQLPHREQLQHDLLACFKRAGIIKDASH